MRESRRPISKPSILGLRKLQYVISTTLCLAHPYCYAFYGSPLRNIMVGANSVRIFSPQEQYGRTHFYLHLIPSGTLWSDPLLSASYPLRNIMVGPTSVCIFSPQEQYGRTHSCSHLIPSRTVWSDPLLFASYPLKNSMVRPTSVRILSPQEQNGRTHSGQQPLQEHYGTATPVVSLNDMVDVTLFSFSFTNVMPTYYYF